MLLYQCLLDFGHAASHEGYHLAVVKLPEVHAAKESFDDDKRHFLRLLECTINVEEFLGFSKSRRELVFRGVSGRFARETSRVCHDISFGVADGDGNSISHHASRTESDIEIDQCFNGDTAIDEIRMVSIKQFQSKLQWLVRANCFWWLRLFGIGLWDRFIAFLFRARQRRLFYPPNLPTLPRR